MTHELKIWPQFYARVADGSKRFEVRKNDRAFQKGDKVVLREFDPEQISMMGGSNGYTDSPPMTFIIGFVLPLHDVEDRVVFSLCLGDLEK